jgi:hypothetical protein
VTDGFDCEGRNALNKKGPDREHSERGGDGGLVLSGRFGLSCRLPSIQTAKRSGCMSYMDIYIAEQSLSFRNLFPPVSAYLLLMCQSSYQT